MDLTYIFHSGFALIFDDLNVIFDYYQDSDENNGYVQKLIKERKDIKTYIISSHFHHDHYNKDIFNFGFSDVTYILSKDILKQRKKTLDTKAKIIFIDKGECYSDDFIKLEAFGSTDEGVSFVLFKDGKSYFHAGDLNNWHWMDECDEKEWQGYERFFKQELAYIANRYQYFDVIMFPVDPRLGSEYMRGAKQFLDKISCKYFCPMHFGQEYQKALAFKSFVDEKGFNFIEITHKAQTFNLI